MDAGRQTDAQTGVHPNAQYAAPRGPCDRRPAERLAQRERAQKDRVRSYAGFEPDNAAERVAALVRTLESRLSLLRACGSALPYWVAAVIADASMPMPAAASAYLEQRADVLGLEMSGPPVWACGAWDGEQHAAGCPIAAAFGLPVR